MAAVPWTNNRVWRGKGSWLPVIFSSRLTCVLSAWVSPPNRPKRHKFIHGLIVVDPESSSNVQSTSGQPIIQTTHKTNQILSLCNGCKKSKWKRNFISVTILGHTHVRFKIQFTAIPLEPASMTLHAMVRVLHFDIPCDRLSPHTGSPRSLNAFATCEKQNHVPIKIFGAQCLASAQVRLRT